jgi:hypothetical protein
MARRTNSGFPVLARGGAPSTFWGISRFGKVACRTYQEATYD